MAELDLHDCFFQSLRDANKYPFSLLRTCLPICMLQRFHDDLLENEEGLFDASKAFVLFWELWSGDQIFRDVEISNLAGLSEHLVRSEKDPKCRHIFIESHNSRSPLNCSAPMLKYLLTFHQVDPAFLELLFTFGDREGPVDAFLSHFQNDNALVMNDSTPPLNLDRFGRSGYDIRHSFMLRSAEPVSPGPRWPWSVRPCAVYHTFDLVNGRTVWITVRRNALLQNRIMDDTTKLPAMRDVMKGSVASSFNTALATHLIYFHWCEENWRPYIRDVEALMDKKLTTARTIPVDKQYSATSRLSRANTAISSLASDDIPRDLDEPFNLSHFIDSLRRHCAWPPTFLKRRRQTAEFGNESFDSKEAGQTANEVYHLGKLGYEDLQTLARIGKYAEEGQLAIELNISVLEDICTYYQDIVCSSLDKSRDGDKKLFEMSIASFIGATRHIVRRLRLRHKQLASLSRELQAQKSLIENLLEFRNLQTSRVFEEHARKSQLVAERIAHQTHRATHSMHFLSIIAFILLAPTATATIMQSGVFGTFSSREDAIGIFLRISLPMAVIICAIWSVGACWGRESNLR